MRRTLNKTKRFRKTEINKATEDAEKYKGRKYLTKRIKPQRTQRFKIKRNGRLKTTEVTKKHRGKKIFSKKI